MLQVSLALWKWSIPVKTFTSRNGVVKKQELLIYMEENLSVPRPKQ